MTSGLILLRHGQTAWNGERRGQGWTDIELDERGHAQAAAAAAVLGSRPVTHLWSSDLSRAAQTASALADTTGLSVVLDERLREYNLGERSGLTLDEFAVKFPAEYAAWRAFTTEPRVPGEETAAEVTARVMPALQEITATLSEAPGSLGVVVGHGGCLKLGLAGLLDWPDEVTHSVAGLANCGWVELGLDDRGRGWRLAAYNCTPPDFVSDPSLG